MIIAVGDKVGARLWRVEPLAVKRGANKRILARDGWLIVAQKQSKTIAKADRSLRWREPNEKTSHYII
jgi:hypothetical protein